MRSCCVWVSWFLTFHWPRSHPLLLCGCMGQKMFERTQAPAICGGDPTRSWSVWGCRFLTFSWARDDSMSFTAQHDRLPRLGFYNARQPAAQGAHAEAIDIQLVSRNLEGEVTSRSGANTGRGLRASSTGSLSFVSACSSGTSSYSSLSVRLNSAFGASAMLRRSLCGLRRLRLRLLPQAGEANTIPRIPQLPHTSASSSSEAS